MNRLLKNSVKLFVVTLSAAILLSACGKSDNLTLSGTVEATQIDANSEVAGKIVSLDKDTGVSVKKGDVLASVDSSIQELVVKQQQAIVDLKQAKLDSLQNMKAPVLPSQLDVTAAQADLEQSKAALEQAKLVLEKYKIKAPSDGTYTERNVNIGDIVNTGANIGTISDLNDLWTRVYIPQRYLNNVSLNQEISLESSALPGKTIKGRVIFISSEAEYTPKNTQTNEEKENTVFQIKIKILDNIKDLKSGMTVNATIPLGGK